jgi:tryptophan synthase alpha chain
MLADRGVAGLIVPDMPAAEAADLRAACDAVELALVPLVAPTTPPDALREIGAAARGFVYVVSVTGVTGERQELPPELRDVVAAVRAASPVPAAVGFGIGTPAQAAMVGEIADGVIIGSRLVREVAEAATLAQGLGGIERFLRETAGALSGK